MVRNKYNHIKGLLCGFCGAKLLYVPRNTNFCDICGVHSTFYQCSADCDFDSCLKCHDVIQNQTKEKLGDALKCLHEVVEGWNVSKCAGCGVDLGQTRKDAEETQADMASKEDASFVSDNGIPHDERLHCFAVDVCWLLEFTFIHNCWKIPTWQVVRDIIKPATRHRNRCRYSSLSEHSRWIGPADVFMSHCWGANFGDLVMASCVGASTSRKVWIDIFAVRQWPGKGADLDFRGVISRCKSVIVATSPVRALCYEHIGKDIHRQTFLKTVEGVHSRRCIAFFRLWCVVELSAAINMKKPIIIKAGVAEQLSKKTITTTSEDITTMTFTTKGIDVTATGDISWKVKTMLSTLRYMVNLEDSACAVDADRIREMNIIRILPGGIDHVNRSVAGVVFGAAKSVGYQTYEIDAFICGEKESLYISLNEAVRINNFDVVFHRMLKSAVACGSLICVNELLTYAKANRNRNDAWFSETVQLTNVAFSAADGQHFDVLKTIMSIGPIEKLANQHNEDDQSLLYIMALNNDDKAMKWLLQLESGVDVNKTDNSEHEGGATALSIACQEGNIKCVLMLLEYGADVNIARDNGDTCLITASYFEHVDIVEILLGCPNIQIDCTEDTEGMSAFNYATAVNNIQIQEMLRNAGCDTKDAPLDEDELLEQEFMNLYKARPEIIKAASLATDDLLRSLHRTGIYISMICLGDLFLFGKRNFNRYSLGIALINCLMSSIVSRTIICAEPSLLIERRKNINNIDIVSLVTMAICVVLGPLSTRLIRTFKRFWRIGIKNQFQIMCTSCLQFYVMHRLFKKAKKVRGLLKKKSECIELIAQFDPYYVKEKSVYVGMLEYIKSSLERR